MITVLDIHNHDELTEQQINKLGSTESIILAITSFLFPQPILAYYNKYFNLFLACILPIVAFILPRNLFCDIISVLLFFLPTILTLRLFPRRYSHTRFNYKAEPVFKNKITTSLKSHNSTSLFKETEDNDDRPNEYYDVEEFIIPIKVKKFFNDISDKPRKRNRNLAIAVIPIYIFFIVLFIIKSIKLLYIIAMMIIITILSILDFYYGATLRYHRSLYYRKYR